MNRKLFQITIRRLLFVVLVFGVVFLWVRTERQRLDKELEVLGRLATLCEGEVTYQCVEGVSGLRSVTYVGLPRRTYSREVTAKLCEELSRIPSLRGVNIQGSSFEGGYDLLRDECPGISFGFIDLNEVTGTVAGKKTQTQR